MMEPSNRRPRNRSLAQRKAAARRRRQQVMLLRLCVLLGFVLVLVVVAAIVLLKPSGDPNGDKYPSVNQGGPNPLISQWVLEAGTSMEPEVFLQEPTEEELAFETDLSKLNLKVPGTHEILIRVGEKVYATKVVVVDTVAPKAEAVNTVTQPGVLPKAEELVKNIVDAGPVKVTYQTEPDVSKNGDTLAKVLLTDSAGNTTTIEVPVKVFRDDTPPVITGVANKEFFIGDSISYKEGVAVTDDITEYPVLTVDNSAVKPHVEGTYPVIYTARDAAGNETSVTVYFTFRERPAGYVEPEVAYGLAQAVLSRITTEDMTKAEVAAAIYNWVKRNITWNEHSDKSSGWAAGAVYGFEQRKGDCFTYYATAKALLDVAGIPNLDIVKVVTPETSQSAHYWNLVNLGDGWYHMDCTPRNGNLTESFFLYTDEEMLAYSRLPVNQNCFNFDLNAYPPRATKSLKGYIEFDGYTQKVNIKESW